MTTTALSVGTSRAQAVKAALFALSLGAALIFVVGFAYPSAIHNAAHDTRHSMSFPCH
jgi:cobalt transporter subunit CbtB